MDQLYSLTLLAALAIGSLGTGAVGAAWLLASSKKAASARLARVSLYGGVLALILGALSALVHLCFGHGQQTPEPMAPLRFFLHHKAYWFVVALAAASFGGRAVALRRRGAPDQEAA